MDDRTLIERLRAAVAAAAELPAVQPADFAALLAELATRLDRLAELEERFDDAVETAKLDAMRGAGLRRQPRVEQSVGEHFGPRQTLLQEEKDPERRRRLAAINSQAFRAHEMIADLMLFARPPHLELRAVNLVELLDDLARRLTEEAGSAEHGIGACRRRCAARGTR